MRRILVALQPFDCEIDVGARCPKRTIIPDAYAYRSYLFASRDSNPVCSSSCVSARNYHSNLYPCFYPPCGFVACSSISCNLILSHLDICRRGVVTVLTRSVRSVRSEKRKRGKIKSVLPTESLASPCQRRSSYSRPPSNEQQFTNDNFKGV